MIDFTDYKHYTYELSVLDSDSTSGKLRKVRVNIIDKNTGECIEEVDVLTSADAVIFDNNRTLPQELKYLLSYTNSKRTTVTVGGIKKGSTFVDMSFKDIFEKLFYPESDAECELDVDIDKSVIYEYGHNIAPVTFDLSVLVGTNNIKSIKLFRDGVEEGTFKNFPANGGTGYYTYTGKIDKTTEFFARVEDLKGGIVESNVVRIEFNRPVYYGTIEEDAVITEDVIKDLPMDIGYIGGEVRHEFTCDSKCFIFAYPHTDDPIKVIDQNGMIITNSFTKSSITISGADSIPVVYDVLVSNKTTQNGFGLTLRF